MKIHLYNLPEVDRTVDTMIKEYMSYSAELTEGNLIVLDRANRLKQKVFFSQEETLKMLEAIDQFYKRNALDPRVRYIYVSRTKLEKLMRKINSDTLLESANSAELKEALHEIRESKMQDRKIQVENDFSVHPKKPLKTINDQRFTNPSDSNDKAQSNRRNLGNSSQEKGNTSSDKRKSITRGNWKVKEQTSAANQAFRENLLRSAKLQIRKTHKDTSQRRQTMENEEDFHQRNQPSNRSVKGLKEMQKSVLQPKSFQKNINPNKTFAATPVKQSKTPVKTSRKMESFRKPLEEQRNSHLGNKLHEGSRNAQKSIVQNNKNRKYDGQVRNSEKTTERKFQKVNNQDPSDLTQSQTEEECLSFNAQTQNDRTFEEYNRKIDRRKTVHNDGIVEPKPIKERKPAEVSSAMKSLSDLIFTIKMTKQEYHKFMRIKEENQTQPYF